MGYDNAITYMPRIIHSPHFTTRINTFTCLYPDEIRRIKTISVNALMVGHWSNDLGFSKMTGVPARDIGHLSDGVSKFTPRKCLMSDG